MGRRRKQDLASELVASPWQVSAIIGVFAFVGMRWIVPALFAQDSVLASFAAVLSPLSWIALCTFSFIALMSATRAARQATGTRRDNKTIQHNRPVFRSFPAEQAHSAPQPAPSVAIPSQWSVGALRMLEWKRFELLCARYYEEVGFKTETLDAGPDGGIDIKLFKLDPTKPLAIVQCKAWNTYQVGVKEIRELLGVMAHKQVGRGIFATTGSYSKDAIDFGAASPMQLLDGPAFTAKLLDLPLEKQHALLKFAFEGDYRTPSCASCGVKMVTRDSKRGAFWGCPHYPRCKTTLRKQA